MEGPRIVFEIPIFGGIHFTETVVISWFVIAAIFLLCLFLTHNLKKIPTSKRQVFAELIVTSVNNMVKSNMGETYLMFAPYIASLMAFSICGSLISLLGLRPITADLNTTITWALITFFMIQINRVRNKGVGGALKSFTEPIALMTPLNLISELATPVSMSFRHFGNIAGGMMITSLLYQALSGLSGMLHLPIPLLQVGIPAVLSVYFDLFSGIMQAYIFAMLTMVFVSSAGD